jgi:site-specific recombinase XerD
VAGFEVTPEATSLITTGNACATHLLEQGASLKEIGDLLGHRDFRSTSIYAKVHLQQLRRVADFDLGGLL